jgi:hypothetical protein
VPALTLRLLGQAQLYGDVVHEAIKTARATLKRLDNCESDFQAETEARNARHVVWHMPPTATPPQAPEETEATQMTQDWSEWDAWAEMHVQQGLERAAAILGDEIGRIERSLLKRIKKLEERVGELRAEQAVTRAAAEVVDLPEFLRKRNDVA